MRLVGYGLAVGLDNTGDRAIGGQTGGPTVQSVINILRRFNVEVPADLIRMRNVAAVLVTAPAQVLQALDRELWVFAAHEFVPHLRVQQGQPAAQETIFRDDALGLVHHVLKSSA
mgnify:CR=1 FL=1